MTRFSIELLILSGGTPRPYLLSSTPNLTLEEAKRLQNFFSFHGIQSEVRKHDFAAGRPGGE